MYYLFCEENENVPFIFNVYSNMQHSKFKMDFLSQACRTAACGASLNLCLIFVPLNDTESVKTLTWQHKWTFIISSKSLSGRKNVFFSILSKFLRSNMSYVH